MTLQNEIDYRIKGLINDISIRALTVGSEHWIGLDAECPTELELLSTLIQDREKKAVEGFAKYIRDMSGYKEGDEFDNIVINKYVQDYLIQRYFNDKGEKK